jgi:Carboxypeptidase regulatory-like domain
MSELFQAGRHPDADQLNAFVERALPAHEQEQTLAHLALCPHCRQIIALSLPAGDESPSMPPEPVRHRWWAWAGIPALAALVLVIFFVRQEQRKVAQTSVLSQMAAARKPAPLPPETTPPQPLRSIGPLTEHLMKGRQAAPATQPTPPAQARPGTASGAAGGVMGGIVGGIGVQPQPPAPEGSFAAASAGAAAPVGVLAANRVQATFSGPRPLPSHLAILSMASRANQRLAIDTDNHLFFSNDEGRNWQAIPSPWKGRAVSVALTSAVSFGSATAALKISSHPAATSGSTLSGTITDPSGAVIPGATLTATNSNDVVVGSATTDSHGKYRIEDLAPGGYRIKAQATGFETQSFTAEVAPSLQAVADATLRVGSAAQTVNIEASPAASDTASASTKGAFKPAASRTLSHFELTTDDGERWMSADGQSWVRK